MNVRSTWEAAMPVKPMGNTSHAAPQSPAAQRQDNGVLFREKMRTMEERQPQELRLQEETETEADAGFDPSLAVALAEDQEVLDTPAPDPSAEGMHQMKGEFALAAPQTQVAAAGMLADQTHIERMAAAIAEALEKGSNTIFTLDFGADASLAQSAVISRDGAGMVSVQMVSANRDIPSQAWSNLRSMLAQRLEKRKLGLQFRVDDRKEEG